MNATLYRKTALAALLTVAVTSESRGQATVEDVACMRLATTADRGELMKMEASIKGDLVQKCNDNPDKHYCNATAIIIEGAGFISPLNCPK